MKTYVGVVPVKFDPVLRKTHEEAVHAVSSLLGSSADFPDSANDMLISEDIIVEEDALCDLRDLSSKHDRGPSALQPMQELCQTYCLAVPSDARAVQEIL